MNLAYERPVPMLRLYLEMINCAGERFSASDVATCRHSALHTPTHNCIERIDYLASISTGRNWLHV